MDTLKIVLTRNCNDDPVYAYELADFTIYNPRVSVCGRFLVSPSEYGLTDADADALHALNSQHGYDDAA